MYTIHHNEAFLWETLSLVIQIYLQNACNSLENLIIKVGDNQDLARASTSKYGSGQCPQSSDCDLYLLQTAVYSNLRAGIAKCNEKDSLALRSLHLIQ
jgi:hypothetical protein